MRKSALSRQCGTQLYRTLRQIGGGNRWASNYVTPMQNDDRGERILQIVAWVLIGTGVASGPGSIFFAVLQHLARAWWWHAVVIVLLFALPAHPRAISFRVTGLLLFVIYFVLDYLDVLYVMFEFKYRIEAYILGFMLTILGLVILSTNDSRGHLRGLFRRCGLLLHVHRKATLAICVASLWAVNPSNSHSLCLTASEICEWQGAYRSAITVTKLSRDAFPEDTWGWRCLSGEYENRQKMSWRIARLRWSAHNGRRLTTNHHRNTESASPIRYVGQHW